MVSPKILSSLMGQANINGEKSTVVHTLIWLIGLMIVGVLFLAYYHLATWIIISFLAIAVVGIFLYFYSYLWCLKNNPDLLRSEKYGIQKLAIENRMLGDSSTGENLVPSPANPKTLSNNAADDALGFTEDK